MKSFQDSEETIHSAEINDTSHESQKCRSTELHPLNFFFFQKWHIGYGWFLQNLEKYFIRTNVHTTVNLHDPLEGTKRIAKDLLS